jgi:hypothetical protein
VATVDDPSAFERANYMATRSPQASDPRHPAFRIHRRSLESGHEAPPARSGRRRYNRYRLVDDRIRDILKAGESVVRDNGERLTSCLVLADEERA